MTIEGVQQNIPAPEPQVSAPQEPQAPPVEAPLTKEMVQQMVAEATAKALADAQELGRRSLQSQQDKNRAEQTRLARRAQEAETSLSAVRGRLQELDPEATDKIELAELRARTRVQAQTEQEELAQQGMQEFQTQFRNRQVQYIKTLGLDPEDKRIDWADGAPNYLDAMTRTLDSVAKLQAEKVQTTTSGLQKRLNDMETAMKKLNIDINSVQTTTSQGVVEGSDADFIKKFAAGDIPLNKVNMERYNKIQKQYD